ncbi:hypothetical protein APHNP_0650 [Anaplasma phagocytophilum str. ApNP]|uniref:Uncharacterized protein n=1 Tax=Anaplasma phagocytophilum str. ApNP TaxID=1359153 RepID=A0A0F3NGD0_ANAPH|nr:hypothetical protein APHNP_0650 [Anaplasma phagocytophilum str. ApNP]
MGILSSISETEGYPYNTVLKLYHRGITSQYLKITSIPKVQAITEVEETALISTTSPPSIVLASNPATMVFSSGVSSWIKSLATASALLLGAPSLIPAPPVVP